MLLERMVSISFSGAFENGHRIQYYPVDISRGIYSLPKQNNAVLVSPTHAFYLPRRRNCTHAKTLYSAGEE
jgi:hypothetical protein